MPVYLSGDASHQNGFAPASRTSNATFPGGDSRYIHIGLINNMPDGALQATERQFLTLLQAAAEDVKVRLSLYALPEVPRSEAGRRHIRNCYCRFEDLWDMHVDALIVTGTEPKAAELSDEPYWQNFTKLLDWAEENTNSSIWSCLAAHAAVLHQNGIRRHRFAEKRFGVFECAQTSQHPLNNGLASNVRVPHSRWNDIREDGLTESGYRVLTRSIDGGVDSFVKRNKSLFVYFQGHPEYEADTLLLEYRRDIGRYIRGERATYPPLPVGYFDRNAIDALTAIQERALSSRSADALSDFPAAIAAKGVSNGWRSFAVSFYRNWLAYLQAEKERHLKSRPAFSEHAARRSALSSRVAASD